MPTSPFRIRRNRALLALVLTLPVVLGACSPLGGKKSVQLSIEATPQCNTCGKSSAQPLEFAVLQVTDPAAITGTSLVQIWGKEKSLFGDALLTRDAGSIVPNSKQPFAFQRNPKARAVIVIGNFCKPDGACWYYTQPLSKGSRLSLKAEASCLAVVAK